jgi:hypothetical protein
MTVRTAALAIIFGLGLTTVMLSAMITLTFFEQAVVLMLCFLVMMKSYEMVEGI